MTAKCMLCHRKEYTITIPLKEFLEINKKYLTTNEIDLPGHDLSIVIIGG